MLNHIVLMGRLTRDPELRYTQSQIPVASFRIAVDRDFGRGEDRQTDFIDVVAWRSTGEFVNKYFHKGSMIVVSGRLQMRDWQDKDGNRRTSAEVVADNVYFGESAKRDGDGGRSDSYGDRSYGGDRGGYGQGGYGDRGGYGGNNSRGGYQSNGQGSRQPSAPAPSAFSELDGDDGELPF
ncbi:MAG TPA: single-stranded DNA-binding protein [Candidatus Scatomorpha stercoravium]|nr:single-stranded DNA-binding protein [Candidatus Scatomorpha stercoravium]